MRDSRITRATPTDIAAVAPLFHAYRGFFAGERSSAESRRFLEERLSRDDSVIFIAWQGLDAAGFIQLFPLWSSWNCRRIWFLSDLYVEERFRTAGLGTRLVKRVMVYAKDTSAVSVMVELPRAQEHLSEFYGRLGFQRDEVFNMARYAVPET